VLPVRRLIVVAKSSSQASREKGKGRRKPRHLAIYTKLEAEKGGQARFELSVGYLLTAIVQRIRLGKRKKRKRELNDRSPTGEEKGGRTVLFW